MRLDELATLNDYQLRQVATGQIAGTRLEVQRAAERILKVRDYEREEEEYNTRQSRDASDGCACGPGCAWCGRCCDGHCGNAG